MGTRHRWAALVTSPARAPDAQRASKDVAQFDCSQHQRRNADAAVFVQRCSMSANSTAVQDHAASPRFEGPQRHASDGPACPRLWLSGRRSAHHGGAANPVSFVWDGDDLLNEYRLGGVSCRYDVPDGEGRMHPADR